MLLLICMFLLNFYFVDGIFKFLLFINIIVLYDVDYIFVNDDLLEWIFYIFLFDNVIKQVLCNLRQFMFVVVLYDNRQICCNDVFIFFFYRYIIVMIYYVFLFLLMMLFRLVIFYKFIQRRGTKFIYVVLYFYFILIVLQVVLSGFLCKSFGKIYINLRFNLYYFLIVCLFNQRFFLISRSCNIVNFGEVLCILLWSRGNCV